MAAHEQHSNNPPDLVEHRRSSGPGPHSSPGRRSSELQTRARRASVALRRSARNEENFLRNRVRPLNADAAGLLARRARTRSLARIEREQLQQEGGHHEEKPEGTQKEVQTALGSEAALESRPQNNINSSNPPSRVWKPSIAIGSPLWLAGEDLSAIEIADRKVAQTRLWLDHYQGVPDFVRTYQEAVREREQLDETDEANTKPRSALHSTQSTAIQQRLRHLRVILQTSHFPPERANIEAAIAGYESGAIPYSDSYTLIWAGRIVDRCPDFDSFTADRSARLDRYEAEHGPSWLWYEPPLSGGGGTLRGPTIVTKRAICLENRHEWRRGTDNMGHYRLRMSFRRRKENVSRMGGISSPLSHSPFRSRAANSTTKPRRRSANATTAKTTTKTTTLIPQPNTSLPGTTIPDFDGPSVIWDTLLDTGATLPCLYEGDLPKLGINPHLYAAQSSRTIATADSVLETRVYELDVGVLGDASDSSSSGLHHPYNSSPSTFVSSSSSSTTTTTTTPYHSQPQPAFSHSNTNNPYTTTHQSTSTPHEPLTCTLPVVFFPGTSSDFTPENHTPERLSGILPFHLCYLSSAPGNFKLWMGETKGDVVGAGRLPGLMRYGGVIGGGAASSSLPTPPSSRTGAMPKLVVRRASGSSEMPPPAKKVVVERNFSPRDTEQAAPWDEGAVERKSPVVSAPTGYELDSLDATGKGNDGLRVKRKREAST